MTKQEKIREGIADSLSLIIFEDSYAALKSGDGFNGSTIDYYVDDVILPYLHSQGVVLKVDKKINGNLVNNLWDAMQPVDLDECRLLVKQALEGAGYYTVELLIKE